MSAHCALLYVKPDDCLRIQTSLAFLSGIEQPFALLFYGKLFELDSSISPLFHNDVAMQGHKLMTAIAALVNLAPAIDTMMPVLHDLGRKHAGYGVRAEHYDSLAVALIWTLAQAIASDFDSATRSSWKMFLSIVTEAMQSGGMDSVAATSR